MVQAETLHMEHLIQDLLYFSQFILNDKPAQLQQIELGKITRQVCSNMEPLATAKQLKFEVKIEVPFSTERLLSTFHEKSGSLSTFQLNQMMYVFCRFPPILTSK